MPASAILASADWPARGNLAACAPLSCARQTVKRRSDRSGQSDAVAAMLTTLAPNYAINAISSASIDVLMVGSHKVKTKLPLENTILDGGPAREAQRP